MPKASIFLSIVGANAIQAGSTPVPRVASAKVGLWDIVLEPRLVAQVRYRVSAIARL